MKDGKHDCFNRERRDHYFAASGRKVPDRSSRECQYSKDVVDAHCAGCKHNQREQATEGRLRSREEQSQPVVVEA